MVNLILQDHSDFIKVFRFVSSIQSDSEAIIDQKSERVKQDATSNYQAASLAETIESTLALRKKLSFSSKLSFAKKISLIREYKGKIITARQIRSTLEEINDNRNLKVNIISYMLDVRPFNKEKNSSST